VDDALALLGCRADVLTIDPHTLDEVLDSVVTLGRSSGRTETADALVDGLRVRLAAVEGAVEGRPRPRALVLEWTDPPFAPGHWVPEMVERAGAVSTLGTTGEKSYRTTWEAARASKPEVVVVAPCGYHLAGAAELAADLVAREVLPSGIPVWAVDANASFARPGPRLVDGIEALAAIAHPEAVGDPDPEMARRIA
jgi:iron complex transport system substrate-binding protein